MVVAYYYNCFQTSLYLESKMSTESIGSISNVENGEDDEAVASEGVTEDLRITYKIDDIPPSYMCLFLGFQHFLTMIGGTLSIPFILCPALCIR